MAEVLKIAFPDEIERERVLCHILHSILRDGSRISCDNFIEKSFASYVLDDVPTASLRCDTAYFNMMGKDSVRLAFFKAFVERMRKTNPNFGKCCYVDSSPLPNDIDNNPFNTLSCMGLTLPPYRPGLFSYWTRKPDSLSGMTLYLVTSLTPIL